MSDNLHQTLSDQEISGHSIRLHQQAPGTPLTSYALQLVVGEDRFSAGMTAYITRPSRGRYASQENIIRARWRLAPTSPEECVRSAIMALQAWLVQEGHAPQ